jgi:hypothetical protein
MLILDVKLGSRCTLTQSKVELRLISKNYNRSKSYHEPRHDRRKVCHIVRWMNTPLNSIRFLRFAQMWRGFSALRFSANPPSNLWCNVISMLCGQQLALQQWTMPLDGPPGPTGQTTLCKPGATPTSITC